MVREVEMSDKQEPPRKYIDIPEAERHIIARHEAAHAAYFLVIYGGRVTGMHAKRRIELKEPPGLTRKNILGLTKTRKNGFAQLIGMLAPWKVRKLEKNEVDYGSSRDVEEAWSLALNAAALEHDPPLVPKIISKHRDIVEERARTYIETALAFMEKHHKKVKPLIDALAKALIKHEKLDQDQINAIYLDCGSPRIPLTDIP